MSNENRMERVSSGVTALDNLDAETSGHVVESLVIRGDLSGLQPVDRARYYVSMCRGLGLNPASQPFEYLRLNGKDILYLKRGGSDQLAFIHRVNRETIDGPKVIDLAGTKLVSCVVRATLPNGRTETATATVPLVDPPNVLMKAESKAKRRATLSILGLGLLDETEVESIPAHEKSETAQVSRADLADAMRELPAATNAPTLDTGARKVPDLAELDNVTGKTSPRPASQPPPAVAPTLDAQDIARVVERLKDARTLATVQEIVTQFSVTADLASEAQKAEVRHAVKSARAAIESGMREPPPDGIDPEPPTPPRGGRRNTRAVPQTTEPASAPVEGATAPVGAPVDLATVDAPGIRSDGGHDLSSRAARKEYLRTHKRTVPEVLRSYGAHSGLAHYFDDCLVHLVTIPSLIDGTTLHPTTAERMLRNARHEALTKAAQTPARRTTSEKTRRVA